jgi:regulation of enolase protein 1 (concanavalin A-like superfamily)
MITTSSSNERKYFNNKIASRNHKKFSSFSANKEMSLLQREFYSISAASSGLQSSPSSSPFTEKVSISFNEDSLFLRERWQLKGGKNSWLLAHFCRHPALLS